MPLAEEFAAEAMLYHFCAEDADRRAGQFPAYQLAAPRPVMLLMAFSIELSLKSFLLRSGRTERQVRGCGHDLVLAWENCVECGARDVVEFSDDDHRLLAIISDLHLNMCLRYRRPSELERLPVFGPLEALSRKFLDLCDAPSMEVLIERGL